MSNDFNSMSKFMQDKLMDKIKKLLELSRNNSSMEESHSALLKARELAIKFGLELSDIELGGQKPHKVVVDEAVTEYGRTLWYFRSLARVIASNFRCESYTNYGGYGSKASRIMFIGLKQDVDMARQLFVFAVTQLEYLTTIYLRQRKRNLVLCDDITIKNDFRKGFIRGLNAKFKEQENKEGWGLILVKDEAVLEAVEKKGLRKGRGINVKSGNREAFNDGFKQGKEFAH